MKTLHRMESGKVLVLGCKTRVLNDSDNTHSFTMEYDPFDVDFDDIFCMIIKYVNLIEIFFGSCVQLGIVQYFLMSGYVFD